MVTGKLISSLKVAVFSILLGISGVASADYMVDYGPGPAPACNTCAHSCNRCGHAYYHRAHRARHYYHHYVHHIRRQGCARVEIIYTTTPYPDFYNDTCGYYGCQPCHQQRCMVRRESRYAIAPPREINTSQACDTCGQGISYDTSTADDTDSY